MHCALVGHMLEQLLMLDSVLLTLDSVLLMHDSCVMYALLMQDVREFCVLCSCPRLSQLKVLYTM